MTNHAANPTPSQRLPVLQAQPGGHQSVMYGDSCSGIPGAPHESRFRQVNDVLRALAPLPIAGDFSLQFALHSGMGPGGLLWRWSDAHPWSSMYGASAWGVERIRWSHKWTIGCGGGQADFCGQDLRVKWHHLSFELNDYIRAQQSRREN